MLLTGSEQTRLVILRGNSASGKSTAAAEIRRLHGARDLSIVEQDVLRRDVLREHDVAGGVNIGLVDSVARYALDHGFHAVVEGILYARHYGDMLAALIADHRGVTRCYYLDIPFEETLRRHATKAERGKYGRAEMAQWYRERDLLPGGIETIIPAASALEDTVRRIMTDTGLSIEEAVPPEAARGLTR